ncbi:hypothetical protein FIBSPDRAFT_742496 [Athelia psychrophila]|uniref:Uncharacterized protein n=1 Tax=Athelia psychrophila TaxID=1759441 RepID=A0A166IXM5_9AGAM|nr:hypothetical protein FIBSPDRAFT_742496 [Fibularhizoctonia sp. CBS 109695]
MGWCRTKWKATPYDYTGYWRHLRDWMTPSRPRAALMSGGIAWRICLNVLVPEDMSEVMLGPDDSGYGRGIRFNGDDEVSWDNELSQDDTPVISGVYKIFTGSGDQTADTSWWPTQSTWQGGSMDVGYWSAFCEEWYLKRCELICSGEGEPKTTDSWCRTLQGWKGRKLFSKKVQDESARVLSE